MMNILSTFYECFQYLFGGPTCIKRKMMHMNYGLESALLKFPQDVRALKRKLHKGETLMFLRKKITRRERNSLSHPFWHKMNLTIHGHWSYKNIIDARDRHIEPSTHAVKLFCVFCFIGEKAKEPRSKRNETQILTQRWDAFGCL